MSRDRRRSADNNIKDEDNRTNVNYVNNNFSFKKFAQKAIRG